ncbi:MAG: zinc ribbon domain-containing protein [Chloroflexota bacterium]
MKNTWKWILGAAVLLVVFFALPFVYNSLFGYGYYGMMGGGYRGYPMMGGNFYSPFGGFGMGLGMILMWGIPLGLLLLAIYGVVRLAAGPTRPAPTPERTCPKCSKPAQYDWNTCPYCGEPF